VDVGIKVEEVLELFDFVCVGLFEVSVDKVVGCEVSVMLFGGHKDTLDVAFVVVPQIDLGWGVCAKKLVAENDDGACFVELEVIVEDEVIGVPFLECVGVERS
jgi:hypothetical protein